MNQLSVFLYLDEEKWSLSIRCQSELVNDFHDGIRLPFTIEDVSIIERALDLSGDTKVKRHFKKAQLDRLRELKVLMPGALSRCSSDCTLEGQDLKRSDLRKIVSNWLIDLLLDPLRNEIGRHFDRLRAATPNVSPILYLKLEIKPDKQSTLLRLPWELLHSHHMPGGHIHLGRYLISHPKAYIEPVSRLIILLIQSDPTGVAEARLNLSDESGIRSGLLSASCGNRFEIVDTKAHWSSLVYKLWQHKDQAVILHFAGHGQFGWLCERCGSVTASPNENPCRETDCGFEHSGDAKGYIAFTDPETGGAHWIDSVQLVSALSHYKVLLLVLNACKTATTRDGHDVFNGMAQRLVDAVPAVVATPYPLHTKAAEVFAEYLYRFLGDGETLTRALHRVHDEIMMPSYPDESYRTVLYMRDVQPDGWRLLDVTKDECESTEVVEKPPGMRSTPTLADVVVWVHKYCGRQVFIDPFLDGSGQGPEMMALRGGRFTMGEKGYEPNERPTHEVEIGDFAIAVTPVTSVQYQAFLVATGRGYPADRHGMGNAEDRLDPGANAVPAFGVSWEDAVSYCRWLSMCTGAVYRLPTENEWEFACRAGTGTPWSFGTDPAILAQYGWYQGNATNGGPLTVAGRKPNPWGLYDMHGNVLEWCDDLYRPNYHRIVTSVAEVSAPSGGRQVSYRSLRGGSYMHAAENCRCARRFHENPENGGRHIGLRVVRNL